MFEVLTKEQFIELQNELRKHVAVLDGANTETEHFKKIQEIITRYGVGDSVHFLTRAVNLDISPIDFIPSADTLLWIKARSWVMTSRTASSDLIPVAYDAKYDQNRKMLSFIQVMFAGFWQDFQYASTQWLPENCKIKDCIQSESLQSLGIRCEFRVDQNPEVKLKPYHVRCVNQRIMDTWSAEERKEYHDNEKQYLGTFDVLISYRGSRLIWNADLQKDLSEVQSHRELCQLWILPG